MVFISHWRKVSPGSLTVPAPLSWPLHCSTMQIRSGGRSKAQRATHRESSDPHWPWDQVHNVKDQYTQGIVSQPLSALSYDLASVCKGDFGFDKDMGLIWISWTDLRRITYNIAFTWFDGTMKLCAKLCLQHTMILFCFEASKHWNMYF